MTTPATRDFDGLDFDLAVGEVYGLRIWNMDEYGRLRARHVSFARPWRPGINTATCFAGHYKAGRGSGVFIGPNGGFSVVAPPPPSEEEVPPPEHPAPAEHCKCGFYAYTIPSHDVEDSAGVVGLVRGTGRTLIGSKGFRCEKAEIAALLDPGVTTGSLGGCRWMRDRLTALYPDVPLLGSRDALRDFAPITPTMPDPASDEFWSLP
ncbi:hypothetical protein [Blastococcus sp. CT_GayMR16]|uniref:hypothetical protein n=1 Tax=Blastococcus sp. CT_GayMR16 TaxID=2559607 RepID=UPI0010743548|nr:hypothetical protein [Blastococcus sp. CT_GayMR16]TFV90434.1 hypothetical protein E4P38_03070 [Blastococcus sp. CT_GayMR16]